MKFLHLDHQKFEQDLPGEKSSQMMTQIKEKIWLHHHKDSYLALLYHQFNHNRGATIGMDLFLTQCMI